MPHTASIVAIDVSKARLDVRFPDGRHSAFANDRAGLAKLTAHLNPAIEVALEATGGYERLALDTLLAQGYRLRLLNPCRVRRFAEATGRLAKTDRIDTDVIADFAGMVDGPILIDEPARRQLADLARARQALVRQKLALANRLQGMLGKALGQVNRPLQAAFTKAIALLDKTIRQLIAANPVLQERANLIASMPGIGAILTTHILANFPELGVIPDNKAVSLAALAPHPRQSGTSDRPRHIRAGRKQLCSAFYLAALCAIRHRDPHFRASYDRLIARGKPPKLALIALARKILLATAAVLRRGTPWIKVHAI
jgi:transposase